MNDDLESLLRDALRPVAPEAAFAERLIARMAAARTRSKPRRGLSLSGMRSARWWLPAVAAALLGAVAAQHVLQQRGDRAAGLEARRQLIQALRLTDQKLDLAYRSVKQSPDEVRSGV